MDVISMLPYTDRAQCTQGAVITLGNFFENDRIKMHEHK